MIKKIFIFFSLFLGLNTVIIAQSSTNCIIDPATGKLINPSTGQECINAVTTSVPFLRIVPDARGGAMGDAGICSSPDASSTHFNSSKLAFAEQDFAIAATYTPWLQGLGLDDIFLGYVGGYKRIDDRQNLGFGLRFFSLGTIDFTGPNSEALGTGKPQEFELALSYNRLLSKQLSVGMTMKYVRSNLGYAISNDQTPGNAVAADISFSYDGKINLGSTPLGFRGGLVLSNIGTKISYGPNDENFIPANFGLGTGFEYEIDDYNSLTLLIDINKLMVPTPQVSVDSSGQIIVNNQSELSVPSSIFKSFGDAPGGFSEEMNELMYSVGLEYWYAKQFALRTGFFNEHKTKGNRKFLTVGLGLKYNVLNFDFAYLIPTNNQRNPLDNTMRITVGVAMDKATNKDKAEPTALLN